MPNADTHDAITYACIPFTFLVAELYWGADHTLAIIATLAMIFSGLMFGPDLDLQSRPYRRWGPLRFIWKPYQVAMPHRSVFSHGPVLGTVVRIVYFLVMFSLLVTTLLYLRHLIYGEQTTWQAQLEWVRNDLYALWHETDGDYFKAVFGGLCIGALSHTAADVIWSSLKRAHPTRRSRRHLQ